MESIKGLITFGYVVVGIEAVVAGLLFIMLFVLMVTNSTKNQQDMMFFQERLIKYWNLTINISVIICWCITLVLMGVGINHRYRKNMLPWLVWRIVSIVFDFVSLLRKFCTCCKDFKISAIRALGLIALNILVLGVQAVFFYYMYILYCLLETKEAR